MGRGGGRGMGRGRIMGMRGFPQSTYPSPPSVAPLPQLTREQEVQTLKSQRDLLQNHLDQMKKRLKELEKK